MDFWRRLSQENFKSYKKILLFTEYQHDVWQDGREYK